MLENTESQEMYLTTIYALQKKNGMVRSVDVADERGYSKVSVHNAMKRLEEFGYVTFHQGKITLTKCGIEKVKNIEQKHQTIASALKLIGASNDIAEENACRMEHVMGAYSLAMGTASLATAGLAMAGVALPGVIVIGGVIILSIGFEHLIRAITGYWE